MHKALTLRHNQVQVDDNPCHRGAYPTMRVNVRIGCSEVSADVTQGEPHLSGRGEAINAGWGACLDEKLCKVRVEATANRSRVGRRHVGYRPRVGERVVAVAEEPIEQYADGEQVGGDVPAIQAGVGWPLPVPECAAQGRRTGDRPENDSP